MKSQLNRRDFLKLTMAFPIVPFLKTFPKIEDRTQKSLLDPEHPNIIILLLDALSALNLSVYGYPRLTDRFLTEFAGRSTVYHAHRSAGNFTIPSTASLFTGTYPWTNRAFHINGLITKQVLQNNVFKLLEDSYHIMGFVQNPWADVLLHQFHDHLDFHADPGAFSLYSQMHYNRIFPNDGSFAKKTLDDLQLEEGSLYLYPLEKLRIAISEKYYQIKYAGRYANGLPGTPEALTFTLEDVFDGVMSMLSEQPSPFFSYVHLFPPHEPYRPYREFEKPFESDWEPIEKKRHPLGISKSHEKLIKLRASYDRYISSVDFEIGCLLSKMEKAGLMDNSYVIITSDHGQLFERGVHGHLTPLMFESIIHIPLIISEPRQREHKDVYVPTSTVDLLPTLLHFAGVPIPEWCEGQILPGVGGEEYEDRSIYTVEAKRNPSSLPLKKVTIALTKKQYKLVYYLGYSRYDDVYELYNLENDPEELENLFTKQNPIAREMRAELMHKLNEVNRPYQTDGS